MLIMSLCARLSTLVSFDQVTALLLELLTWSPSKTTVEKAVLGFGRYTSAWFEQAPRPEGDGEILVVQVDSKATPTATEAELEKRRGRRDPSRKAPSPRHRGRDKRSRAGAKTRRKKGDKSKNGKAATIVVMYTLKQSTDKDGAPLLLGRSTAGSTPLMLPSVTRSRSHDAKPTNAGSPSARARRFKSSPTVTRI